MRFAAIVAASIVVSATSVASAQYDFDDFFEAVESGRSASKSTTMQIPPSLYMDRFAQVTELPPASDPLQSPANTAPTPAPAALETLPAPSQAQAPMATLPAAETFAPALAPVPLQPIPGAMNFEVLFQQQEIGLSTTPAGHRPNCQSCDGAMSARECAVMPYRLPNLPAPSTIQGYFNSPPCVANVWDGYSCDAAAECAKRQKKLMTTHRPAGKCATGNCP